MKYRFQHKRTSNQIDGQRGEITPSSTASPMSHSPLNEIPEFTNSALDFLFRRMMNGPKLKNIMVALHQKFSAKSLAEQGGGEEEDWLENLEFTVKNKSDKHVTYLAISLRFPHPGNPDRSVGMFYHFVFGVDLRASGQAATYAEPFSLDAGASHTIRLSEKGLKEIKSRLAMLKRSLLDVNTVSLGISIVGFEDGKQWQNGKYSIPEKHKQSDKKVIENGAYKNVPCAIVELSVKNIRINSRETLVSSGFNKVLRDWYEFSAESVAKNGGGTKEDWLETLELTIKNNSDKQITYIGFSIRFPETTINGPMMVFNSFRIGIHPKIYTELINQSKPLALLPGETTKFILSIQELKLIKSSLALRKFQLAELNKADISLETLIFEDGIIWDGGNYFKPSSSTPSGYIRIER